MANNQKLLKEKELSLVDSPQPRQKDPYTGQTQLFDKIRVDEFALDPDQRIYPRPNSRLYEGIIQKLFSNYCYDVESGEIFNCQIGQYRITGYLTAREEFTTHRRKKSIAHLFQLLCSIVVERCYDWHERQIKDKDWSNYWIDVPYELFEQHGILQHHKSNSSEIIGSRAKTLYNYYRIIKTIELTIFDYNEPNKKQKKITGQSLFGSIEMHRSFFRFKIEAPVVGKAYGKLQTIWDILIAGYVGLLFPFSFKLKTAEASNLVEYCSYILRTNAKKQSTAISYETIWKVLAGDIRENIRIQHHHTNKRTRFTYKGTILPLEKGKNSCGDLLDLLIEEIDTIQEEVCPVNPEDTLNNSIDRYLILKNNREKEELILEAGKRPKRIYEPFAIGQEKREQRLSTKKKKKKKEK